MKKGVVNQLKQRYIPPFIMLLAGAITSIINIVNKVELFYGLKRLLLVIIIFYFLGLVVKAVIKMAITKFAKKEPVQENGEENPEESKKSDETKKPEDKKS